MKLKLDITPDLVAMMAAEIKAGEKAVTKAVNEAGTSVKSAWRAQITGAGLGQRLANTIRSEQFPKGRPSLNAAAVVWSKAPVIVGAHETGPLIRSRNGFWLAIPTPAAGKSARGGRITPGEWERRSGLRLRFVYRRTGPSLLVAEGRLNTRGRAVANWTSATPVSSTTAEGRVAPPCQRRRSRNPLAANLSQRVRIPFGFSQSQLTFDIRGVLWKGQRRCSNPFVTARIRHEIYATHGPGTTHTAAATTPEQVAA